jgi:hypothetical protein
LLISSIYFTNSATSCGFYVGFLGSAKKLSSTTQLSPNITDNEKNYLIEKLKKQLQISNKEIINLKQDNDELKKLDNQSDAVKELDKMSRQFNDKTSKLILLQTTVDLLECSIKNQKQVTESIRKKLDNAEFQLSMEKTNNKKLSDEVANNEH